jgi:heme-degrading monooxygenase HmoA
MEEAGLAPLRNKSTPLQYSNFRLDTNSTGGIDMNEPALALLVRFKSRLTFEEVMKVVEDRAPEFRALAGLQQKYYLHDEATGEVAGLYLWDSPEALTAYRESELRASIAQAYQAEGEPRVGVYRVVKTLRTETD